MTQGDILTSSSRAERQGGEGSRRQAAMVGREEEGTGEKSPSARILTSQLQLLPSAANES